MSTFKEVISTRDGQQPTIHTRNYAYMAETSLPRPDYDSLMKAGEEACKILHQSGLPIDHSGEQVWPAGADRLNAQVRAKHSATPKVSDGFKRFVEHARTAMANAK